MQSPGIGMVLHWRPSNVHIFDTDQSLVVCKGNFKNQKL